MNSSKERYKENGLSGKTVQQIEERSVSLAISRSLEPKQQNQLLDLHTCAMAYEYSHIYTNIAGLDSMHL